MVLEALAAVGLAGNIVQFVDFSYKLFNTTTSVYNSHAGLSGRFSDLEIITRELQQWCVNISSFRNAHSPQLSSRYNQSLLELAKGCESTAAQLVSAIHALRSKNMKSKWSSFRAALAAIWKEPQIRAMEESLNSFRSQLHMSLIILQSDDNTSILTLLNDLSDISKRIGTALAMQISDLKRETRDAMKMLQKDMEKLQFQNATLPMSQESGIEVSRGMLASKLIHCQTYGSDIAISLGLLDCLTFEQMHFRHSDIHEAHPRTFEWVFENIFQSWAESSDPLFWISGKPGSGKSTLMKYLVDNPKTPGVFQHCSSSQQIVIVNYFFWINGTAMQRSQEGLLRVLLYDILRQCPELIKDSLPEKWMSASTSFALGKLKKIRSWTRKELMEALRRLSLIKKSGTKFCIFIDGLDEYSGDHDSLIDTIHLLTTLDVKLCIASRPWNMFEDAFGSNPERKLYLQDLNKPDIKRFVHDRLKDRSDFQRLQMQSTQAEEIVTEIVEKSQGVFLWVYLVVRSLVAGLRNRDTLSLLRKRLREFPSDLDRFFRHMFLSMDQIYRTHISHMFQVALVAGRPLSPLAYWFLDELEEAPDKVLSMPIEETPPRELGYRVKEMAIRINGRCRGLLEVTASPKNPLYRQDLRTPVVNAHVDFLHRTVKDFFLTTEMQQILSNWQTAGFNPDLDLCKILLAQFKSTAILAPSQTFLVLVGDILSSVARYESSSKSSPTPYLDELERTMNEHIRSRPLQSKDVLWGHWHCLSFLEVVTIYDLRIYIEKRLKSTPLSQAEKYRLLMARVETKGIKWSSTTGRGNTCPFLPEMITIISSLGPLVTLDEHFQENLSSRLALLGPNAISRIMKGLCRCSLIATDKSGEFKSEKLRRVLQAKLSAEELDDVHFSMRQANRSLQTSVEGSQATDQRLDGDKVEKAPSKPVQERANPEEPPYSRVVPLQKTNRVISRGQSLRDKLFRKRA